MTGRTLRVRWLGRVRYQEALSLQRALWASRETEHLLLLEHPHVYTLGVRARPEHVLVEPASVGAELVRADRGGDVTYHGPGQIVGYPIIDVPSAPGSVPRHVHTIEEAVLAALGDLGVSDVGRLEGYPGVWFAPSSGRPRKVCAVGVRIDKGRSMHGFALNLDPDLEMFSHIVPCGLRDMDVTSLAAEGLHTSMREVVDLLAHHLASRLSSGATLERQDAAWPGSHRSGSDVRARPVGLRALERRLADSGVEVGLPLVSRKPDWIRAPLRVSAEVRATRSTVRSLGLVTVCEEAGCPNLSECWGEGTATFMINGDRCTRSCGFCLVDTGKPGPLDVHEPERVAEAVRCLGLDHAVVTAVARDDLPDGGASAFAKTVEAIRARSPETSVEVLIPDLKGDPDALGLVLRSHPDVVNHNLETPNRLQRAVRPAASYARSLALLARAADAGALTKSGVIVGMGERLEEVKGALVDLKSVGVQIVTIGQYLRPSADHVPVARWWTPDEIGEVGEFARGVGFGWVEASPLTRSSHHARRAFEGVAGDHRRFTADGIMSR